MQAVPAGFGLALAWEKVICVSSALLVRQFTLQRQIRLGIRSDTSCVPDLRAHITY